MAKKKEEVSGSRFEQAIDRLEKTYGVGTVLSLDKKISSDYDVISSGSIGIDYKVLQIGGYCKGRLYELMGWEGVGKSTLCGHVMANCQKNGGKGLYIDSEHAIDINYFEALGVDLSKMYVSQPSYGEEGFNVAMEMINSGEIDLVIIDSDSSMLPKKVVDGEIGESAIGKKAILNSNAYPKLKNALVSNNVCVIVVSQYREKIGMMFGNPTTTQGGHALKFYSDCRIEVSRTLAKDGEDTYGAVTKIKSIKNKTASPFKKCEFEIIFGKGIDELGEVVQFAAEANIINKSGSWYSYGDTKLGQGDEGVRNLLIDNPELYEEIREKVINSIKDL